MFLVKNKDERVYLNSVTPTHLFVDLVGAQDAGFNPALLGHLFADFLCDSLQA
jgi:hypothetical protein